MDGGDSNVIRHARKETFTEKIESTPLWARAQAAVYVWFIEDRGLRKSPQWQVTKRWGKRLHEGQSQHWLIKAGSWALRV